ncbi:type II toxin-antitoxin system Phd/YefM family antitoxin [Georgenia sp. Z1344]|uniref:type II toxin-antitoxin system Phd/YefM family antitoxin n=1 Tax=Georgenia sp. Z1344 TaxID=3416706 RepID=UPI003CEBB13C
MATDVSHREFRNRSGEVLHAVAAGESYTVTSRGKPVARLVPITGTADDLPLHRPASTRGGFSDLLRYSVGTTSAETIDDLRGER